MILLIGLLVIIIDQIIKIIVTTYIPYAESIGGLIKITNVANTGMAYSIRKTKSIIYNYCKYFNYRFIIYFCNKK